MRLRERSGSQLARVAGPFGDEDLGVEAAASDQRRRELGAIARHVAAGRPSRRLD